MQNQAFIAGQKAFVPGWTNHLEHNPYPVGTEDHKAFKSGWNREADHCEYGQEVE